MPDDPEAILEAINDRAITWLVVPEGGGAPRPQPATAPQDREALASALTGSWPLQLFAERPRHGTRRRPDRGNDATESCVRAVLDPEGEVAARDPTDPYAAELARRAGEVASETRAQLRADRDRLRENGRPLESYRRLTLDQALGSLGSD